jgi:hypothetical protein
MALFGLQVVESASENLPDYLWQDYLPLIVRTTSVPGNCAAGRRYHVFDVISRILKILGLREIPGCAVIAFNVLLQRSSI